MSGISRSVYKKDCSFWSKRSHVRRALVADIYFDAIIGGFHHRFFVDKARRLRLSVKTQSRQCGSARGQMQEFAAGKFHIRHEAALPGAEPAQPIIVYERRRAAAWPHRPLDHLFLYDYIQIAPSQPRARSRRSKRGDGWRFEAAEIR